MFSRSLFVRILRACLLVGLIGVAAAPAAQATGTPDLQISGGAAATVLYGQSIPVSVTAANPAGQPKGYNLAFRAVLPAGTSYVPGSAGSLDGEPTIVTNAPTTGKTTLIWPNVDDLVPASSHTLSFQVAYNTTASAGTPQYDVGDVLPIDTGAYISTQPRDETDFDTLGQPLGPGAGTYTGKAEQTTNTTLTAIKVIKSEPHPEGEIPRGVHDQQTTYTLTVTNNGVNPTNAVSMEDYLPAGLEFLGCAGTADHTTNAPTNPGSASEYPGSGPITVAHPTAAEKCVAPDVVETVNTDPDGAGPLPAGVYTHVKWNSIGDFPASGVKTFTYAAAIPIRQNTMDWNGAAAGNGTAPAITGAQAANLDNNNGPETYDEQPLLNGAIVNGTYQAPAKPGKAVSDEGTLLRTAEDIAIQKTNDNGGLEQGDLTKWTVNVQVSEYRYVDNLTIHDVIPNGLCPLSSTANLTTNNSASDSQCNPVAGKDPSQPYTTVSEQPNGTFDVTWTKSTFPTLARIQPNGTRQLTFWTRTRDNYQSNFQDAGAVLSKDAVTNNIDTFGPDFIRCAGGGAPDCSAGGTKIDHDEADGVDDTDVSGSGKAASGPVIEKTVAATYPAGGNCNNLAAAQYGKTVPQYGPGDKVCWKLRLVFPQNLDTTSQDVFDILPSGIDYVPGSWQTTVNNTLAVGAIDTSTPGRLRWPIGAANNVDKGAQVFEVTLKTIVGSPLGHHSGDVEGNLQKFSYVNTAGTAFPLRDRADFALKLPELSLVKGIAKINSTVIDDPAGPADNIDHKQVNGGDVVQYRVDVKNAGTADASSSRVWDLLPGGISCTNVVLGSISDGGTCNPAFNRIEWTGIAVAKAGTRTLTYRVAVPASVSPDQTLVNTAGVVEFTYTANDGSSYQLIPANDVVKDASLPAANAAKAQDVSDIYTPASTIAKARTTSLTETGNSATQATIGETIDYTVTTTIPKGTTLYGAPTVVDALGANQTLVAGSLCAAGCTLDGVALPTAGVSVSAAANTITAAFPVAAFPAPSYVNSSGHDQQLILRFSAKVADTATNVRSANLPNTATFSYKDELNRTVSKSSTVNTTIVEPKVAVTKTDNANPNRVSPGQIVTFTVNASNGTGTNVSTAHDLVVSDVLPAGTDPVDNAGTPIPNGGAVTSGGIWTAATRTITWNKTTTPALAAVAPGATVPLAYKVKVESPGVVGRQYVNTVALTSRSIDGSITGGRTAGSNIGPANYQANASDTLKTALPTVTKDVSPDPVTIGNRVTWHVRVTLPSTLQYFDTTVQDTVPDGFDVDSYGTATCTSGCLPGDPVISTFTRVTNANGTITAGWYLGDLAASASNRVYDLVLNGHVRDTYRVGGAKVLDGQTLTNSASVKSNRTNKVAGTPATIPATFDDTAGPGTAASHIVEPKLAIAKSADKGPYVQGADNLTYTVKMTNNGTSPAYDVVVNDQPDTELTNVVPVAGAGFITNGWTAASPDMSWTIPGPIAVGATVTLTYTASVKPSSALRATDQITNTAAIGAYYGVPKATRVADGFVYRTYTGPSSTVTLIPDFPTLSLVKTTGAPGNPDIANAEVGQPFTWRVVVTNTSHIAVAKNVDVKDTLPPNWTYIAGSSVLTPGGTANPVIAPAAGGDVLSWNNVTDLAPGASLTVVFQAKPTVAAATTPGIGAANAHTNTAVSTTDDQTGASGNLDGPYVSNADTAKAVLNVPVLTIAKTPDHGAATAGTASSFTIVVKNTDATATARNVVVHDVLQSGLTYTPGTATASPSAGFSETGAAGQVVDWKIATLAPGASVTITVPVAVGASVANGTTLVNTASTHSDEAPTDKTDTGSLDVVSRADLQVTKTASPDPVVPGTNLVYTIVTKNNGPSDALAATMTDTLPAAVSYVSNDDNARCTRAGQVITCSYGTLAPGATRTVNVTVTVNPGQTATFTNTAKVTTTTTDTNAANNTSSVDSHVTPRADVSITKQADKATYNGGDTVTWTLVAHNAGPSTAQNVTVDDDIPAKLDFVSVSPGAPTCTQAAGHVHCDLGALAPGADRTVTIVTKAQGSPPVTDTGATHKITVDKVEQYVGLQPGETRTMDLTCPNGGIAADGTVQVVDVDQGRGTPADVQIAQASSIATGTYRFTMTNTTSGQAQIRPHVTCLPATTDPDSSGTHPLVVGALQELPTGTLTPGRYSFTIPVDSQHHAIAQGIQVLSGVASLVASEPVAGGWKFTVDVRQTASVKLSLRLLNNNTGAAGSPVHAHAFSFQHIERTVTVGPGRTNQIRVSCPVGYEGIVGTYDLPAGVTPIGSVPEPVNRDFDVYNANASAVDIMVDLECIGIQTGGPLAETLSITNTATVATSTFDTDHSNDSASATVTVQRAAGFAVAQLPVPAPSSPSPSPAPGPSSKPALTFGTVTVARTGSTAVVPVTCAGSATCTGTVTLAVGVSSGSGASAAKVRRVVLGTARYRVGAHRTSKVTVRIASRHRALARSGRVKAVQVAAGRTVATSRVVLARSARR